MKKKIFYILLFLSILSTPFFALAQGTGTINGGTGDGGAGGSGTINGGIPSSGSASPTSNVVAIPNPFKGGDTLSAIIDALLTNVIEPLAATLVVIMIIYSGFKYVTAQGNSGEIQKANMGLLYTLIGALILLGAVGISHAITGTLCQLVPAGCQ